MCSKHSLHKITEDESLDAVSVKPSQKEILRQTAREIATKMSITEKIYQVLMLSVSGKTAGEVKAAHFRYAPGAVILFKFNVANTPQKVHAFIVAYQKQFAENSRANVPAFFAIDNEGGAVFRTSLITSVLPYASDVAKHFTAAEAETLFAYLARQMKALHLSMNLAPVCEAGDEATAVLGKRLFSANTTQVADYATRFVAAHAGENIACVVKHFPGSGHEDTHRAVSKITGSRESLLALCESFRIPLRHAQAVMLSHSIAECLDNKPFCLSPASVDFLKTEFRYDGLIMSDDIIMKALRPYAKNYVELAYQMISAGCDLILYSASDFNLLVDGLAAKAEQNPLFLSRVTEAVEKILLVKLENGLIPAKEDFAADEAFDAQKFYSAKESFGQLLRGKSLK